MTETGRLGALSMRLALFHSAPDELRAVLTPPWPRWLASLHPLGASTEPAIGPEAGEVTVTAALSAVRDHLHHRLSQLAWVAAELQELGWTLSIDGDDLIASRVITRQGARESLDAAGVAGVLTAVSELDEDGWPRLFESWELHR